MKILFIVRSTMFTTRGGDTIQVEQTVACLRKLDVEVDIKKTNEKIDYTTYDMLHFFNIIRPADILVHIRRSGKPFIVSTILVDYSFYDKQQRPGMAGRVFRKLPADLIEYLKTVYRWLSRKDSLASISFLWKGQYQSIKEILRKTQAVLVQAEEEYADLVNRYGITANYAVVYNGVDTGLFKTNKPFLKNDNLVLCVARIEGIKNQYNLIRALNNSEYRLFLIGNVSPGQHAYYEECKKIAAANISFIDYSPQQALVDYYAAAKVHVLPSWFEVCGLSSMEAAAMGCRIVITANGYAGSYFKDEAFYCDPSQPGSILEAIEDAASANVNGELQKKITQNYTWHKTAEKTLSVYKKYIA